MKTAALFDFHNTLATCDGWLELEIKTLPARVILELCKEGKLPSDAVSRTEETIEKFKVIRQQVRISGVELRGIDGVGRVFHDMGISSTEEDIERTVAALEVGLLGEVEPVEGADDVLRALHSDGLRLGVVSSAAYQPFVDMALEKLGLRQYFSVVVTSAGEGVYKSDPEIYRRALAYLGVEPHEAVHIGDHPVYDVQSAKAAGLSAIWFSAHSQRTASVHSTSWDDMTRSGNAADAVISDLRDVVEAIRRL